MSEKKNVIEIPLPKGYEQCHPIDATHVLLDGIAVAEIFGKPDEHKWVFDPLYPPERYIDGLGPRVTAYLREVPKPEPFRAVLEDCALMQATVSKDGQCRVTLTAWGKGLLDADFPGKRYRVTIEEVDASA